MSEPVFVCYAREDESFVLWLASELRARGIGVWLDQWDIAEGSDWDEAIDTALARCAGVIAVLSPASVTSREVRGELATALDAGKPVVPVMLKRCKVPRRLRYIQYLDVSTHATHTEDAARVAQTIEAVIFRAAPEAAAPVSTTRPSGPKLPIVSFASLLRRSGEAHPASLLALTFPFILAGTWQAFRLPIPSSRAPMFALTLLVCAIALWLRNRAAALLVATSVGVAFVLKPWVVPFNGFSAGSETALNYSVPACFLLFLALVLGLASSPQRLLEDLRRLKPGWGACGLAVAMAFLAWSGYRTPTRYEALLPLRAKYAEWRLRLGDVAAAIDGVDQPFALSAALAPPLVLDRRSQSDRPQTTGHLYMYPQLREPESYFGTLEYTLSDAGFVEQVKNMTAKTSYSYDDLSRFATSTEVRRLQQDVDAPYLVVVKSLAPRFEHAAVDLKEFEAAQPFRVFLYDLVHHELRCALDLQPTAVDVVDLRESLEHLLVSQLGAKILRDNQRVQLPQPPGF